MIELTNPIKPGRGYVFSRNEVARYVTAETAAFTRRAAP